MHRIFFKAKYFNYERLTSFTHAQFFFILLIRVLYNFFMNFCFDLTILIFKIKANMYFIVSCLFNLGWILIGLMVRQGHEQCRGGPSLFFFFFFFFLKLSVKIQLDLFDKMIKPILLYGCEVWGFGKNEVLEQVLYSKLYGLW
jgi:hypothetical protein